MEFDRQVDNLIAREYPQLSGLSESKFRSLLEPLRALVPHHSPIAVDLELGCLPFVIVVKSDILSAEKAMSALERQGKRGVTILRPHTSENFQTISMVVIPNSKVYLLLDIDRGKETTNVPPSEAMNTILNVERSPLTIEEGIAIVTHYPEFLMKNNCFSLLASRTGSDQRVPAIWINAKKEPNLGWCWDGNPHTWLGSASCKQRVGY